MSVPVRHAVSGIVSGPASPVQAAALGDAIAGEDLLAVAPTGSGKTLVFAVGVVTRIAGAPSIPGRPRALVVSPTRELAIQSDEVLAIVGAAEGLRTACFVGGGSIAKDKRALIPPVDIAVGTPGRLVDLVTSRALRTDDIAVIVLDEVDQLVDASFRKQTEILLDLCADATLMSVTATAGAEVEDELRRRRPSLRVHRVTTTPDGDPPPAHSAQATDPAVTGSPRHLLILTTTDPSSCATALSARCRRALFFVPRRDSVEPLRAAIADTGVTVTGISGSASPTRRAGAFGALASGTVRVLVTTDLAGRGLDLDDIGHIVHVGAPHSVHDLVHRSGRTGRGTGSAGIVAAVVEPHDLDRVIDQAGAAGMTVETIDADAPSSAATLGAVFGDPIDLPRQRRAPAPRSSTRRPANSRVHRPKRKKRT
ncbi:helicase [Dietzia sp. NCCP-2495]|uniref:DEAD/DEAH box helicase n=1 Tax=Dietzia sp. NCCP-2495 TaxID=2934675 RepID=UPI00222EDDEE|nr:DEAD/DEAH box helicase [Dietzia sp. NCCP-2495]GLB64522.1 helicase [Dietzia sp. NCCP-2495]